MRTLNFEPDKFQEDIIDEMVERIDRNMLHESGERFIFGFYTLYGKEYSEDFVNRRADKKVRELVGFIEDNNLAEITWKWTFNHKPSSVDVDAPQEILDSIVLRDPKLSELKVLRDEIKRAIKTTNEKFVSYDNHKNLLTIGNRQINFRGKSEKPFMEAIFQSDGAFRRKWFSDELQEIKDPSMPESVSRRWGADTARNINEKLRKHAGVDDLFLIEEVDVRVNPDYLP